MKKLALLSILLLSAGYVSAQKYSSKTGKVSFEASVPLFDDIFAQDDNNIVILNADSGEMASVSTVKNFHFKTKLMEEHFNESYAESAKYLKQLSKERLSILIKRSFLPAHRNIQFRELLIFME